MLLNNQLHLIKQKQNNKCLNILCTDIELLCLFDSCDDYKIGVLNNITSQIDIIKKWFHNVMPIQNIESIKKIRFDLLLCDNPYDLKNLNHLNIKYVYTSFKPQYIPAGYQLDLDFKNYGHWFKQTNINIDEKDTEKDTEKEKNILYIQDDLEQPANIIMPQLNINGTPKVFIVIPTYNKSEYTIKCLNSIDKYASENYSVKVILVDNGSDEQNKNIVNKCINNLKNIEIEIINFDNPIGYIKATNAGIKEALKQNADYICLQNNDTVVTKNWMDLLINPIKDNIVGTGPTTNSQLAIQGFTKLRKNNILTDLPEDIESKKSHIIANTLQKLYKDKIIPITLDNKSFIPAFFCAMFRADIFKRFLLDECYGFGYGDDVDFCFRIMKWGLQLAYIPAAYVLHNHRTTFSTIYEKNEIKDQITAKLHQCNIVNSLNPKNKKRGVIYTCITNNYDNLKNHLVYNLRDFDYICFTNKDNMANIPQPWQAFNIEPLYYFIQTTDNTKIARYFKTHPHMFFRNYEISIWLDGNIQFIKDPAEYIKLDYENMLILEHPYRNCIYQQAKKCIALHKDTQQIINEEIDFLLEENYPSQNGLVQSGILLRNHNNKDIILIMEKWWEMILNYSKRDQLSFNYIVWKYKLNYTTLPWNNIENNFIQLNSHHNK